MLALSIPQPWASLLAADIDCPVFKNTSVTGIFSYDVLLYASPDVKSAACLDSLPFKIALKAINLINLGVIERLEHLPFNAVVGRATLLTDSVATSGHLPPYRLKDCVMFDKPIYDVDSGSGLFEIPSLNASSLPELKDDFMPLRDGSVLRFNVSATMFNAISHRKKTSIVLNIFKDNFHLFCSRNLEPKITTRIVFEYNGSRIIVEPDRYECYEVYGDEDLSIPRHCRESHQWAQVHIGL
ncbi:MAG: hypothetical protein NC405_02800 [Odoribacter sp.]|nr:hypothetical protein [Odoribacter sp.]